MSRFPRRRQYYPSWENPTCNRSRETALVTSSSSVRQFVQLYSGSEPALRAFVHSLVLNWADTDDIVQATATVLWQKFDTFEPGTDFLAWACRIAQYEVLMHRRRLGRSPLRFSSEFIEAVAVESIQQGSDFKARDVALFECIDELNPRQRELMKLRYGEGASVSAMAEKLDRSVESLYKSTYRIRKMLMDCVQSKLGRENPS